jgi:hypothetical protein
MGYAGFSLKEISRAPFARSGSSARAGVSAVNVQKRRIAHGAKLTLTSDFLQGIILEPVPVRLV